MARVTLEPAKILEGVDAGSTLRLAQALIRIPSVNPPGEEAAVAEYLGDYLARAGLVVEVSEVLPGRPNLVATAEFGAGGPTLLLNGHTDVVAVGDGLTLQNVAPAMEITEDRPVVAAIRSATAAVRGRDPGVHGWTATADSNMLVNDLGIPTVIFGPGSIRQVAHQANEYVPVEELEAATRIYALAIADLLGRAG